MLCVQPSKLIWRKPTVLAETQHKAPCFGLSTHPFSSGRDERSRMFFFLNGPERVLAALGVIAVVDSLFNACTEQNTSGGVVILCVLVFSTFVRALQVKYCVHAAVPVRCSFTSAAAKSLPSQAERSTQHLPFASHCKSSSGTGSEEAHQGWSSAERHFARRKGRILLETNGSTVNTAVDGEYHQTAMLKKMFMLRECDLAHFDAVFRQLVIFICATLLICSLRQIFRRTDLECRICFRRVLWQCILANCIVVTATFHNLSSAAKACLATDVHNNVRVDTSIAPETGLINFLGHCSAILFDLDATLDPSQMLVTEVHTVSPDTKIISYDLRNGCHLKKSLTEDCALEMMMTAAGLVDESGATLSSQFIHTKQFLLSVNYTAQWRIRSKTHLYQGEWAFAEAVLCTSVTSSKVTCLFTKGDAEELLEHSTRIMLTTGQVVALDKHLKDLFADKINQMEHRCLGIAFRPTTRDEVQSVAHADFTFLGICGLTNVLREGVAGAFAFCRAANICTIAVTSESSRNGEIICRKSGIFPFRTPNATKKLSLSATNFLRMSRAEKRAAVQTTELLSNAYGGAVSQFFEIMQSECGYCVALANTSAMEGKGTLYGFTPTRASQEYGEREYIGFSAAIDNIWVYRGACAHARTVVHYIATITVAHIFVYAWLTFACQDPCVIIAPPLVLWANLLSSIFVIPVLIRFRDNAHDVIMPPLIWRVFRCVVLGCYIGVATVAGYAWSALSNADGASNPRGARAAQTVAFSVFVLSAVVLGAVGAISETHSVVVIRPSSNACLTAAAFVVGLVFVAGMHSTYFSVHVLMAAPLLLSDFKEWRVVLVLALPALFVDEVLKFISRRLH